PPATLAAFAIAFIIGYCVNFFLNFLMNSIAFWTLETFAVQLIVRWASDLLSGQILPLTFFPGILGRLLFALPFAAIYSTPLLIYVGVIPPDRWAASIAAQLIWLVAFAGLSALVWRAASRKVVIQAADALTRCPADAGPASRARSRALSVAGIGVKARGKRLKLK